MTFQFKEDVLLQESISNSFALLKSSHVEIGLPSSASERNRFLLSLHERGAPGAHIPPRPVVAPALGSEKTQSAIAGGLTKACEAAAEGNQEGVTEGFHQAGQAGVDGIRTYIDAGIEPGNAPLTIEGGWIRNFVSGKPVKITGKGFDKPLYDTGELYNAFDYEVKES